MGVTVGIDLGTTYSAVALVDATGRPSLVRNASGAKLTPSVVAFQPGAVIVGEEAKALQAAGEREVASFFKRSMCKPAWRFEAEGRTYTAQDLSAILLRHLKEQAEKTLGERVERAVVTVPAYFNNEQREATRAAGVAAGLDVLGILNEPTAAAIAFGLGRSGLQGKILVYDLGGGTFDVTLMEVEASDLRVLTTNGDHELGGKDWDDRLAAHVARRFQEEHGLDVMEDDAVRNELLTACERAKVGLSATASTKVRVTHGGVRAAYEVTRAQFEEMTTDLLERTLSLCERVLDDKGVAWTDLAGVLLVGGSTRMPMVHAFVQARTGRPALAGVDVDEAVALGAAVHAARPARLSIGAGAASAPALLLGARRVREVTAHSLGMIALNEARDGYVNSIILPKDQPIPAEHTRPYRLRTGGRGPHPMEIFLTQGESDAPGACMYLGKYVADDVPAGKRGEAIVDVTYAYDENAIVGVQARHRETGNEIPLRKEPVPDDMSWVGRPPPRQVAAPTHRAVVLVLDVSGSMSGAPLEEAKAAAERFVTQIDLSSSSIGVVAFGSLASVASPLVQDAKALRRALGRLDIAGSTNMAAGLAEARSLLAHANGERFLVLLTDGGPDSAPEAMRERDQCVAADVRIVAVGTRGADRAFLARLATSQEDNLFAPSGRLADVFGAIAQQITGGGA